jgi:hypothetical protein
MALELVFESSYSVGMPDGALSGTDLPVLDGDALYRIDDGGTRVVVLPARCRRGHLLSEGYRVRDSRGVLVMRCSACAAAGEVNPCWRLRSVAPVANVAELDDAAYLDLGR